jgi:hypothetical protein
MTRGQEQTVSGKVFLRDRSSGMPGTRYQYDFVANGGYTPTPVTGTPCNVPAKGKLTFSMYDKQPGSGQPVMISLLGQPKLAQDIPLNIYVTADGLEPYFFHNGPMPNVPGTKFRCRNTFTFANGADEIIDEWEEEWN